MDESCLRHEFRECAKQVTALIPLYNQEKYLERFFSSIKKLLEYGCQIDISDNCSTDSSLRKTQAFAEQQLGDQIRIFRQNTNRGVVANNSYLWEHAKSPYVFLLTPTINIQKALSGQFCCLTNKTLSWFSPCVS